MKHANSVKTALWFPDNYCKKAITSERFAPIPRNIDHGFVLARTPVCYPTMYVILTLGILFFFSSRLNSQEDINFPPPDIPPTIQVAKASNSVVIDGRLDESDWKLAKPISDFFRREPRQGGPIRYKTTVRFLYDDKNLYVSAICEDSTGRKGVRVQDLRRDFRWGENDIFGIALDPQNLKQYTITAVKTMWVSWLHNVPM